LKNFISVVMSLIFIVIFNVVFFVAGGVDHPASVWIAYAIIHIAYLVFVACCFTANSNEGGAVLGLSTAAVGGAYFVAEFIVGLIVILIGSDKYIFSMLLQIIMLGGFLFVLLASISANISTNQAVAVQTQQREFIREASSRIQMLIGRVDDANINKTIERAYDYIATSPIKSTPEAERFEIETMNYINELERACRESNTQLMAHCLTNISNLMKERNRRINF